MAKEGLWVLACAGLLAVAPAGAISSPADDRDSTVATTLAVQTAMQQGRDYLLQNNPRAAVDALERQLPRINGNAAYLALLRDAYRAYIKELHLAKQEALAQKYSQLLAILEPTPNTQNPGFTAPPPPPAKTVAPVQAPAASLAKAPVVRGKREDDDLSRPILTEKQKAARDLVTQAEQAFGNNKYREAGLLFEQAFQADHSAVTPDRDQWAYCKLYHVLGELNQQSTAFTTLEQEVRTALNLNAGPSLDTYGRQLLTEIDKRRQNLPTPGTKKTDAAVTLRDLGRAGNWSVVETTNFRIYHNQAPDTVQKAAQAAETTRTEMYAKWFGGAPESWNPKCSLYLYATGQEYTRATEVPSQSPGHSRFQMDNGRVISREIHVHCDNPSALVAVLPHEATHVVLAGGFAGQPIPRWADEGIAVLTEPREKIEGHLRNLPQHNAKRQLFGLRELIEQTYQPQQENYPEPRRIPAFYAQSVSVVDFLTREKGPQVLTQFVRDGMRSGYESALQRHYGFRNFEEFEQRWKASVFRNPSAQGVAQGYQ
jgi:hypothetical protein